MGYSQFTTYSSLLTTYYSLLTTFYLLHPTYYLLLSADCVLLLLTTYYPLLTTHYFLLTTHYPLLSTYSSLLTTYYSLLATYKWSFTSAAGPSSCFHSHARYSLLTTHGMKLYTTDYSLSASIFMLLSRKRPKSLTPFPTGKKGCPPRSTPPLSTARTR